MARGKQASAAEARRVREAAIAEAERLSKANALLVATNEALVSRVEDLKVQVSNGISADLTRVEGRLSEAEAELRAARAVLHDAEVAIRKTYEGTVRGLAKLGIPLTTAMDRADEVTTFLIKGELLSPGEVSAFWGDDGKLLRVSKKAHHKARGLTVADRLDSARSAAAVRRQTQGIE